MRELDVFPLPPGTFRRSSGYGPRTNPVTGQAGTFHRGVDYSAPAGTPLFAPFSGNVTTGYEAGGAGNWIWVVDGPNMFKSFHHSAYQVRGGHVNAGDVIAYIGTTGSSTGPHAHLELWDNGRNIDPTAFLDRAPLKGAAPAPKPEEEEEVKSFIGWQNNVGAFEVWGIFRRPLTPDNVAALKFFAVEDKGMLPDNFWALKTTVPHNSIAGEG